MSRSQESANVHSQSSCREGMELTGRVQRIGELDVVSLSWGDTAAKQGATISAGYPFRRYGTHGLTVFAYSYSGSSVRYVTQR